MNLARTNGYKTVENAKRKLESVIGDLETVEMHWTIAVNNDGRFVPVVHPLGEQRMRIAEFAHKGITTIC